MVTTTERKGWEHEYLAFSVSILGGRLGEEKRKEWCQQNWPVVEECVTFLTYKNEVTTGAISRLKTIKTYFF